MIGWWESALGQLFFAALLWWLWSAGREVWGKLRALHEARRRPDYWQASACQKWVGQVDRDAQRSLERRVFVDQQGRLAWIDSEGQIIYPEQASETGRPPS